MVNNIEAAWFEQAQGVVEVMKLAGRYIDKDKVEACFLRGLHECNAIHDFEGDAWIVSQVTPGDGGTALVGINGYKVRGFMHTIQYPGRACTSGRTKL